MEFPCLKRGCTGSSESTLVKMSNCWKSHAAAYISTEQVCDTDDVEIDVADLSLGSRYTFRVSAVNEMGQGPWLEADGDIVAKDPWGKFIVIVY